MAGSTGGLSSSGPATVSKHSGRLAFQSATRLEGAGGHWRLRPDCLSDCPHGPAPAPLSLTYPRPNQKTTPSGTSKEHYGHFDVIMGKNARTEVWPHILGHLEQHDAPVIAGIADLSPEELAEAEAEADAVASDPALLMREGGLAGAARQAVEVAA
jgi:hypothetical protein